MEIEAFFHPDTYKLRLFINMRMCIYTFVYKIVQVPFHKTIYSVLERLLE